MTFLTTKKLSNPTNLVPAATVNAQTGTTYTYVESDAGQIVQHSNASAITATIPPNGTTAFPIGTVIYVFQTGAGQITFTPGIGVTLNSSTGNLTTSTQNSAVRLRKTGTNTWYLFGDLTVTSNVIFRAGASSLSGTVSKTALATVAVGANKLGTNKCIAVELVGRFSSVSTTHTLTLEAAFGGTVMWADVTTAQTAAATSHPITLRFLLCADGATNAQRLGGLVNMGTSVAPATGAGGDITAIIASATGFDTPVNGTATVDSTSSQNFIINATLSATTNSTFNVDYVIAYMLGEGQKGDAGATGLQGLAGTGTGTLPLSANSPQSGTTYTAAAADIGALIEFTSASAVAVTIPANATTAMSVGSILAFAQGGAGALTITAAGGVTFKPTTIVSSRQDGIIFAIKTATDTWRFTGDYA